MSWNTFHLLNSQCQAAQLTVKVTEWYGIYSFSTKNHNQSRETDMHLLVFTKSLINNSIHMHIEIERVP